MFENINNESFKEWFKKLRDKIAEEMADSPDNKDTDRHKRSMLEQAGYDKLEEFDHMISMAQATISIITHHKSVLVKTRDELLQEIHERFGKQPEDEETEAEDIQENTEPESEAEEQTQTDNLPRLAQLEEGLSNAITVLSGTKMASYFKAIKQLVEDLTVVANADEMPEDQRAESIEDALLDAVNVLSKSACAARSKVTIDLRENLIELLDKVKG
jgi:hypothetical protein